MIIQCKSCNKSFNVPDDAIVNNGRLVQCSSCGNKWTQFPIPIKKKLKKKQIEKIESPTQIKTFNKTKKNINYKKKKKSGPALYSKEYLETKHGLNIETNTNTKKNNKRAETKNKEKPGIGFYGHILIISISFTFFAGVLNQTKEIIISYYPFAEEYINYFFEALLIIKTYALSII